MVASLPQNDRPAQHQRTYVVGRHRLTFQAATLPPIEISLVVEPGLSASASRVARKRLSAAVHEHLRDFAEELAALLGAEFEITTLRDGRVTGRRTIKPPVLQ